MKKVLIFSVFMAISACAAAAGYSSLVLSLADGTERTLAADGLSIVFSGGNMVATQSDGTVATVGLSSLSSMRFSGDSGVASVEASAATVAARDGIVYVTASAGSRVAVFNLSGMAVGSAVLSSDAAEAVGGRLPAGIYFVNVDGRTTKLYVK